MCGIAGIAAPLGAEQLRATANAMATCLAHRGPDSGGVFVDRCVALAHRRLAIIDTSPAGHQPMTSHSGRWTVVLNGEIYNFAAIRRSLPADIEWRGHSDTEVLVEAIDSYGIDQALERTDGMFAFAAWDAHDRRLVLARDRLGEKPLYWSAVDGHLTFASELSAIRAGSAAPIGIDKNAAAAMLRWSFVPHPRTIYEGVHQLPPGCLLDVDCSTDVPHVRLQQWWSLPNVVATQLEHRGDVSVEQAAEELRPLLAATVASRLVSDVPLGVFLSGGIDSSLVAMLAEETLGQRQLATFTVSMPELGLDESPHAAKVAALLGTDHRVLTLSARDVLEAVPALATTWDEPFGDPSMLPVSLMCGAARNDFTVCLGGDGGDELFAGYNRHVYGLAVDRFAGALPPMLRGPIGAALGHMSPQSIDRAARVLPRRWRLPNLGDKVHKAGAMLCGGDGAWGSLAGVWAESDLLVAPAAPAYAEVQHLSPIEEMMLRDTMSVLPDQMFAKLDRPSMRVGLEVRAPFVSHHLLEWAWRQPMSVKASRSMGKLVLRRLAAERLPTSITERRKMGFDPPLASWLRGPLRPWAEDLLRHPRSVDEGLLRGAALRTTWDAHQSGRINADYRLWTVLMLESWFATHRA